MRCLLFSLCALILAGCGSDPIFIAENIGFRVNFTKQKVRMTVHLNSEYSLPLEADEVFQDLGRQQLAYLSDVPRNVLQADFFAGYHNSTTEYPLAIIQRFPNGRKLPSKLRKETLYNWTKTTRDTSFSLIFEDSNQLNFGGAIWHPEFDRLPEGFMGTQKFRDQNGDLQATVTALGPYKDFPGGLYYFAYMGRNPFRSASNLTDDKNLFDDVVEWEVRAEEEMEVQSNMWDAVLHFFGYRQRHWNDIRNEIMGEEP